MPRRGGSESSQLSLAVQNHGRNRLHSSRRLIAIATTIGVGVGLAEMPYGYYSVLRLGVCACCLFLLFGSQPIRTEWQRWTVGAAAVLYNPILPVRIGDKEIWIVLNVLTVVLLWIVAIPRSEST